MSKPKGTFTNNGINTVRIGVLKGCARCAENHVGLSFRPFKGLPVMAGAAVAFTHWTACPTTGDPILMSLVHEEAPGPGDVKP